MHAEKVAVRSMMKSKQKTLVVTLRNNCLNSMALLIALFIYNGTKYIPIP